MEEGSELLTLFLNAAPKYCPYERETDVLRQRLIQAYSELRQHEDKFVNFNRIEVKILLDFLEWSVVLGGHNDMMFTEDATLSYLMALLTGNVEHVCGIKDSSIVLSAELLNVIFDTLLKIFSLFNERKTLESSSIKLRLQMIDNDLQMLRDGKFRSKKTILSRIKRILSIKSRRHTRGYTKLTNTENSNEVDEKEAQSLAVIDSSPEVSPAIEESNTRIDTVIPSSNKSIKGTSPLRIPTQPSRIDAHTITIQSSSQIRDIPSNTVSETMKQPSVDSENQPTISTLQLASGASRKSKQQKQKKVRSVPAHHTLVEEDVLSSLMELMQTVRLQVESLERKYQDLSTAEEGSIPILRDRIDVIENGMQKISEQLSLNKTERQSKSDRKIKKLENQILTVQKTLEDLSSSQQDGEVKFMEKYDEALSNFQKTFAETLTAHTDSRIRDEFGKIDEYNREQYLQLESQISRNVRILGKYVDDRADELLDHISSLSQQHSKDFLWSERKFSKVQDVINDTNRTIDSLKSQSQNKKILNSEVHEDRDNSINQTKFATLDDLQRAAHGLRTRIDQKISKEFQRPRVIEPLMSKKIHDEVQSLSSNVQEISKSIVILNNRKDTSPMLDILMKLEDDRSMFAKAAQNLNERIHEVDSLKAMLKTQQLRLEQFSNSNKYILIELNKLKARAAQESNDSEHQNSLSNKEGQAKPDGVQNHPTLNHKISETDEYSRSSVKQSLSPKLSKENKEFPSSPELSEKRDVRQESDSFFMPSSSRIPSSPHRPGQMMRENKRKRMLDTEEPRFSKHFASPKTVNTTLKSTTASPASNSSQSFLKRIRLFKNLED